MHKPVRESLIMGIVCSLLGFSVSSTFSVMSGGEGFRVFPFIVTTTLVSLMMGYTLWQQLVANKDRASYLRGVAAGALAAICGHLLVCLLLATIGWFGEVEGGFLASISAGLVFGLSSIALVGWLTIPVGALIGIIGIKLRRTTFVQTGNSQA